MAKKPEEVQAEIVQVEAQPMDRQVRGEIDMQVATAMRYPRSIKKFKEEALALACLDDETAASCFYVLPRGGRSIEGPSARLAEIVANAWGHMRIEAKVVDVDDKHITARAVSWDLQKNVAVSIEVKRRITDKNGHRYNDDMIVMTGNAACSIALRNAVFKVVPNALTKSILEEAKKVAVGDAETLASKRTKALEFLKKMGATDKQVFETLGVKGANDISLEHLATLRGLATAIKEGDTTIEEAFNIKAPERAKVDMAKIRAGKEEAHTEPGEVQEEEEEVEPEEEAPIEDAPEETEEAPVQEEPKAGAKPKPMSTRPTISAGKPELEMLKESVAEIKKIGNRSVAQQKLAVIVDLTKAFGVFKDVLENSDFATEKDLAAASVKGCRDFADACLEAAEAL